MKVLIACEESQRVSTAFRERGHEAYSCDVLNPSGGHPEWHIKGNVLNVLNPVPMIGSYENYISFITMDGLIHTVEKWDLIIAHPPCTYLTCCGNSWFDESKYGNKAKIRRLHQKIAINFFMQFVKANCDKIVIENPVGIMNTIYRKPDQIIHPWQFGENECKRTCLWLKNVKPLKPTKIIPKEDRTNYLWNMYSWGTPQMSQLRSKTFKGIASAMANQWG